MKKVIAIAVLLLTVGFSAVLLFNFKNKPVLTQIPTQIEDKIISQKSSPTPSSIRLPIPPISKVLSNGGYHIFQSFNNCGPASLSMALGFYGIDVTQQELGQSLRPFQTNGGDNDDKSVTLEEMAEKSKDYGFIPYHRPMGNPTLVKQFIALGIPVITRTWTTPTEDIGHYRVIKGYDENRKIFIQDDSLQDKNLEYSYDDFSVLWEKFNYEYLVLVPRDKQQIAEQIFGDNIDEIAAWEKAVDNSKKKLAEDPSDIYARFNLAIALFNTGDYKETVREFEMVENQLPFRTLWYQIEPIQAYYELGNYDKVFAITDGILNNYNRAFSELYIIRGKIYQKQGNATLAREEFEKAYFYNKNLPVAKKALDSLGT